MRVWIAATVFAVGFCVLVTTPTFGQSVDTGESQQRGDVFRTKQGRFVDANGAGDARIIPAAPAASMSPSNTKTPSEAPLTIKPGESPSKAAVSEPPRPAIITPDLRLTPMDGNIRKSLNKWMKDLGYQDVAWQLPRDIPIERYLSFTGTLDEILLELAQTQAHTPRAMRFCIHTNKVVRAIPVTQFCKDAS